MTNPTTKCARNTSNFNETSNLKLLVNFISVFEGVWVKFEKKRKSHFVLHIYRRADKNFQENWWPRRYVYFEAVTFSAPALRGSPHSSHNQLLLWDEQACLVWGGERLGWWMSGWWTSYNRLFGGGTIWKEHVLVPYVDIILTDLLCLKWQVSALLRSGWIVLGRHNALAL